MVYSNFHSLVYKKVSIDQWKICILQQLCIINFSQKAELCKGLLNRMNRSWSFRDIGWDFNGLNGRESVFKSEGSWREWSTRWVSIVGNQYFVVQLGIIMIPMVLFDDLWYGCSYKTKRWKCIFLSFPTEIRCYAMRVWHPRDIFVYLLIEMGGKQINLGVKLKLVTQNFNDLWESIHSVLSLKILDTFSLIVFSTPRMWEEIQKPLFCVNSHIRFAISLQRTESMPLILLIYVQRYYQLRCWHV